MVHILGVDPGAVHVGVSEWVDQVCTDAREMSPAEFAFWVECGGLNKFDRLVAENYVPQGGFGDAGTGVATLKLLGYLEWTWNLSNPESGSITLVTRNNRAAARKKLQRAGYRFKAYGSGDHAADAESVVVAGMRWSVLDLIAAQVD